MSATLEPASDSDEDAYLARVLSEIEAEVRAKRASGELPARVERELDELFLEFSPVAGRAGGLHDALRMVDAATFIDPVVPVGSAKSGGAGVKKGLRSLSLWYVGYITHQVSQLATAVSRALHILDEQVTDLRRQLDAQRVPPSLVVEADWANGPDAWWVEEGVRTLAAARGRVLHTAAGDGWLVRRLTAEGVSAYGVDPRPERIERAEFDGTDLRDEDVVAHLRAVESAALDGIILSGVVDGMTAGERLALLDLVVDRLSPGGTLVVHSLSRAGWESDQAPVAADLCGGHPLRLATWSFLLGEQGFDVRAQPGPEGLDYLVVGVLGDTVTASR